MSQRDLDEGFRRFHAENPAVYDALVRLARRARERGRTRISVKMLWEVVRFETWLGDERAAFRLNNNYTSRYARLIMEREPDLAGAFEVKPLKSDMSPSHGAGSSLRPRLVDRFSDLLEF